MDGEFIFFQHNNISKVQLYRGRTFYSWWTDYAAASTLPMLITEFGVDSYHSGVSTAQGEKEQADWNIVKKIHLCIH
jgi:hypothetical protein